MLGGERGRRRGRGTCSGHPSGPLCAEDRQREAGPALGTLSVLLPGMGQVWQSLGGCLLLPLPAPHLGNGCVHSPRFSQKMTEHPPQWGTTCVGREAVPREQRVAFQSDSCCTRAHRDDSDREPCSATDQPPKGRAGRRRLSGHSRGNAGGCCVRSRNGVQARRTVEGTRWVR